MKHGNTGLTVTYPWGTFVRKGSKALCADGKIRSLANLSTTANTFFSIPAAIRIGKAYITGYVSTEDVSRKSAKYVGHRRAVIFHPHTTQTTPTQKIAADSVSTWPERWSDAAWELFAVGETLA